MNDILAVCINNSYEENMGEEKLRDKTREAWRIGKHRLGKIKYIVGFYNKKIKSIYKVKEDNPYKEVEVKRNGKLEKRYSFNVYEENEIYNEENKIVKNLNNTPLYRDTRYFSSEDLI